MLYAKGRDVGIAEELCVLCGGIRCLFCPQNPIYNSLVKIMNSMPSDLKSALPGGCCCVASL